jgi:hypothetical protein
MSKDELIVLEAELTYVRSQLERLRPFTSDWLVWVNRESALVAEIKKREHCYMGTRRIC